MNSELARWKVVVLVVELISCGWRRLPHCIVLIVVCFFSDLKTWHPQRSPVTAGLANVRRHEMLDFHRLNFAPPGPMARDNLLMDNRMSSSGSHRAPDVTRQDSVAFAPRNSDA